MGNGPYSFLQTIDLVIEERLADVNTGGPGKILKYDAAKQRATVQPQFKIRYRGEDDEVITESLPPIDDVPVHFAGNELFGFVFDVQPGQNCWLKWSQHSLDDWLTNGEEAPASEARRFHFSDAVAEMGIRDFGHPRFEVPKLTMRIGAEDGPQIRISLVDHSIEIAAVNEVRIAGEGAVRIESTGDVTIQGRRVDPTSTEEI
jgi:hypothetical protein